MKSEIDMKLLERSIQTLTFKYGYLKISLEREDGSHEGVWAVSLSDKDELLARSEDFEHQDDTFKCILCNEPIGTWLGKSWGDIIICRNRGSLRPLAFLEDNFDNETLNNLFR
jgi:hypothetical protein